MLPRIAHNGPLGPRWLGPPCPLCAWSVPPCPVGNLRADSPSTPNTASVLAATHRETGSACRHHWCTKVGPKSLHSHLPWGPWCGALSTVPLCITPGLSPWLDLEPLTPGPTSVFSTTPADGGRQATLTAWPLTPLPFACPVYPPRDIPQGGRGLGVENGDTNTQDIERDLPTCSEQPLLKENLQLP